MFHRRNILSNVALPHSHPAAVRYNASHENDTRVPIQQHEGLFRARGPLKKRPAEQRPEQEGLRKTKACDSKRPASNQQGPEHGGPARQGPIRGYQYRPASEKRPICNRPASKEAEGSFPGGSEGGRKEPGWLGGTADKVTLARTILKPEHGPCSGEFLVTLPLRVSLAPVRGSTDRTGVFSFTKRCLISGALPFRGSSTTLC